MDDYSHLRKARSEDEEETLINEQTAPKGGEECLRQMKYISELITKVTFSQSQSNLLIYYYIGRHHLLKIRVYLFDCILICFRRTLSIYCRS